MQCGNIATGTVCSAVQYVWSRANNIKTSVTYIATITVTDSHYTYLYTYLLTPCCRVLLEQLTGLQLVKKFPEFHGTRRFITALTSVHHLSLSWASPIQSIYPHPTSWRSILILSTHLCLSLPSGLLPSGVPTKTLYTTLSYPYAPHAQPISFFSFYHPHCNLTLATRPYRASNHSKPPHSRQKLLITQQTP